MQILPEFTFSCGMTLEEFHLLGDSFHRATIFSRFWEHLHAKDIQFAGQRFQKWASQKVQKFLRESEEANFFLGKGFWVTSANKSYTFSLLCSTLQNYGFKLWPVFRKAAVLYPWWIFLKSWAPERALYSNCDFAHQNPIEPHPRRIQLLKDRSKQKKMLNTFSGYEQTCKNTLIFEKWSKSKTYDAFLFLLKKTWTTSGKQNDNF